MFRIGLVADDSKLLECLKALPIWCSQKDFELGMVCASMKMLKQAAQRQRFDLLLVEARLACADGFRLLDTIRRITHVHVVLCSMDGDFACARQGILHQVDDYLTFPFSEQEISTLFGRIRSERTKRRDAAEQYAVDLLHLFQRQEQDIYRFTEYLRTGCMLFLPATRTVNALFELYDWLDLYLNETDYLPEDKQDPVSYREKFLELFHFWTALYPHHNEDLEPLLQFILMNPESDLRQKKLSEELRINKSYLSTIFTAQTNIRFVDYVTNVKLMRAAWLLRNTSMKVSEVAARMEYKDLAYFSKQFKKLFSIPPSEYRIPDNYEFEI